MPFLFFVIVIALMRSRPYECFNNNVIRPQVFDSVLVSDAMYFKERRADEIEPLLMKSVFDDGVTRENAQRVLKEQLGQEYNVVSWDENQGHYDIVVHAPHKMYGYNLISKKDGNVWDPRLMGYVFEDKIMLIPGVGDLDKLSDFEKWPFPPSKM
jgi:hypothetical protein